MKFIKKIEDLLLLIREQKTLHQLLISTQQIISLLDGKFFIYIREASAVSRQNGDTFLIGTFPAPWGEDYKRLNLNLRDPSLLHARKSGIPFVWRWNDASLSKSDLETIGQAHKVWPMVSCPIHDGNRVACFTLATNRRPKAPNESLNGKMIQHMGHISILAVCFHEQMNLLYEAAEPPQIPLTNRERACLVLTSHGLTAAQISQQLNITPRTVTFHLSNVKKKLAAKNIIQAVATATTMNII